LSTRSAATLHITNGDAVVYLFRKAGILGTHVGWRDSLNDGPLPAGLSLEETSALRARYLAARGYGNAIKLFHDFSKRDAQLRKAPEVDEIVLWFEHDLYDQLQILQVLTALEKLDLEPGRISTIQSDQYLGTMNADELAALLPRRRTATAAIFRSARRAWERVTSSSPADLHAAAMEDAIGLPHLRAAMQRFCEEYPWVRDGLSRSQRQALQAVAQGPATQGEVFVRAQAREEAHFLTETAFQAILADLRDPQAPLLEEEGGRFVLTALGRRVLAGDADWLERHVPDRWVGGVHLHPGNLTRWDDERAGFVFASR
jgi:hypothetical protein